MVSERALIEQNLDQSQFKKTPIYTIPHDDQRSREAFKCVPGMAKYLEKQYVAMVKKEEDKLIYDNLGKNSTQKKSLNQVVNPNFAYGHSQSARNLKHTGTLNRTQLMHTEQKRTPVPTNASIIAHVMTSTSGKKTHHTNKSADFDYDRSTPSRMRTTPSKGGKSSANAKAMTYKAAKKMLSQAIREID